MYIGLLAQGWAGILLTGASVSSPVSGANRIPRKADDAWHLGCSKHTAQSLRLSLPWTGPGDVSHKLASVHPQEFIRLGSLSKLSGKGLQQRMFFLVSSQSPGCTKQGCWGAVGDWELMVVSLTTPLLVP